MVFLPLLFCYHTWEDNWVLEGVVCGYFKANPAESPLTALGLTSKLQGKQGKGSVCEVAIPIPE